MIEYFDKQFAVCQKCGKKMRNKYIEAHDGNVYCLGCWHEHVKSERDIGKDWKPNKEENETQD